MATDDDMSERIQRLESKFDGLEKKIDQLPTKQDFERMTNKVSILVGEAKDASRMAAEGYKATLDRIESGLGELDKKVSDKLSDHDRALANHNDRLAALEPHQRLGGNLPSIERPEMKSGRWFTFELSTLRPWPLEHLQAVELQKALLISIEVTDPRARVDSPLLE